ncbi:hypothetical protein Tco_0375374 [Tanacetum coccineum]
MAHGSLEWCKKLPESLFLSKSQHGKVIFSHLGGNRPHPLTKVVTDPCGTQKDPQGMDSGTRAYLDVRTWVAYGREVKEDRGGWPSSLLPKWATKSGGRFISHLPFSSAPASEGPLPLTFLPILLLPVSEKFSSNPTPFSRCLLTLGETLSMWGDFPDLHCVSVFVCILKEISRISWLASTKSGLIDDGQDQSKWQARYSNDVFSGTIYHVLYLGGKALVERERDSGCLTSASLTSALVSSKALPRRVWGLRVEDSHIGNCLEDSFMLLETIQRFQSTVARRSHSSSKRRSLQAGGEGTSS